MTKTVSKRIMPILLIVLVLFSIVPIPAYAAGPEISTEPTIEITDSTPPDSAPDASGPEISTGPNDDSTPPSSSLPPDSSTPAESTEPEQQPESQPDSSDSTEAPESESTPADSEAEAAAEDEDAERSGTLDGATVHFVNGNSRARLARATGTLSIQRVEAYQWNFEYVNNGMDMRPWYIMTIDGQMAYCVEPTNPDTHSGGYDTMTWDGLTSAQRYTVGYAMLYGATDSSNPLLHMATQTIIWEICLGYMDLSSFTLVNRSAYDATIGYNPAAAGYYDSIIAAMRSHSEVPTFTSRLQNAAPLHKVPGIPGEYKIDLVNTNPRVSLADFNFQSSGSVTFTRENETLHVSSPSPLDGNTVYSAFKGSVGEVESLVFWGSGEDQIRATAGVVDPVPAYFRLTTQDAGPYQITIRKLQQGTNNPLAGAEFQVRHAEKGVVGNYTTDGSGKLTVSVPWQGTYIITEITPPSNHLLARDPVKDVVVTTENPDVEISFHNEPFSGIQITKVDATTKTRIPGVTFRIARKNGLESQEVVTGASGIASLPNLTPDWYTITEISCPPGYILDPTPYTVEVKSGEVCEITIENYAKPSIEITKVDADNGQRLAGATFRVARRGSTEFQDIVSGADGIARLSGMEPDYYIVKEIVAPDGYILEAQEQTIEVVAGQVAHLTMQNSKKPSLEILKIDSITKQPLPYATFRISYKNGEILGSFTTDADGRIFLDGMAPGLVVIEEITAPDGYIVTNAPQEMLLKPGGVHSVTFENTPKSPVIIKKVDSATGEPLPGATFRLTKMNGELVGEYTTGRNGYITIPELQPGWYIAVEIKAPEGYRLNDTPINVQLKMGDPAIVEFENSLLPGLQIRKVDAVTKEPLQGVTIRVTKMNGEVVGEYRTNSAGLIAIPDLAPGWYTAYETATVDGYILDTTPQNVELRDGKTAILEFTNKPLAGLSIIKVDSVTGRGLAGVEFELTRLDGSKIGTYTTDEDGRLFVPGLKEGWIFAKEISAPEGYKLDTQEQRIEIKAGVQNVLTFKNHPYPFLVIQKVDADSGEPLEGVKFRIFSDNGREIGTYTTGAAGRIVLTGIDAGHYQVQEVEAAPGYLLDNRVWDVTLEWGKTTTIKFKNILELGQIQIIKVAAEDNTLTKEKKGDKLEGAVFEIYNEKLEVVDTITTDQRGLATSRPLPLGKYIIKEVESPEYWLINDKEFEAEITEHEEIVRFEVEDAAPKISVTVNKRGVAEAQAGSSIRYDFWDISNTSNVPLEDFFWRDFLPTDAVRLETIYTGTWNEELTYSVTYKTNLKDRRYTVLAEDLSTKVENRLVCDGNALGLAANEYITEFRFEFGTVQPGFKEVAAPYIFVKVREDLPNEYQFVNRTDVGGRYGEKWTTDKDSWVTILYSQPKGKLPKTGVYL